MSLRQRHAIWCGGSEHAYSVRAVIRIMPPFNLAAMNDDYQDARVLEVRGREESLGG